MVQYRTLLNPTLLYPTYPTLPTVPTLPFLTVPYPTLLPTTSLPSTHLPYPTVSCLIPRTPPGVSDAWCVGRDAIKNGARFLGCPLSRRAVVARFPLVEAGGGRKLVGDGGGAARRCPLPGAKTRLRRRWTTRDGERRLYVRRHPPDLAGLTLTRLDPNLTGLDPI